MAIIDSQVHVYEANTPKRPWHNVPNWPPSATGDEMVTAMDKVGVDGAIFISAFSMYRYDASYAVEVQRAHPSRFAPAEGAGPGPPQERGHQGERGLHTVAQAVSLRGHLGSARPRVRRLGLRALACGAPTGPAPSRSSTTSRPSSRFAGPSASRRANARC